MQWIKEIYLLIEYLAVAIIVGMVAYSIARHFASLIRKRNAQGANYLEYKHTLGRALLLGLGDPGRCRCDPYCGAGTHLEQYCRAWPVSGGEDDIKLELVVEIEGHWPWRAGYSGAEAGEHTK